MTSARPGTPGATRACPHCRETILESAVVCPGCKHYLRFGAGGDASPAPAITPLRIEGGIRHPADADPWEYTVVVTIKNGRGEEIARKLIGVGALDASDQCTFALTVEAVEAKGKRPGKGGTRH
ncbi:MAG TPA: hypothetical protein VFU81_19465 [Thermomicrobiales bacterium]|nr:hypothetical protein [Thermomicrobiales bacterium]